MSIGSVVIGVIVSFLIIQNIRTSFDDRIKLEDFAYPYLLPNDFEDNDMVLADYPFDNILFVHVGKAGGITVEKASTVGCLGKAPRTKPRPLKMINDCVDNKFPKKDGLVLPYKLNKFMHMFSLNETELSDPSNAFLFTLRNPVDRFVSAYRYGHPQNCVDRTVSSVPVRSVEGRSVKVPSVQVRPVGTSFQCGNKELMQSNKTFHPAVQFYNCFPTVEDIAQYWALPSPEGVIGKLQKCRRLAHICTNHTGQKNQLFLCGNEPHKHSYNYRYYASETVLKYPDRPVMAVRTEHAWEDIISLDKQLGGTGNFTMAGLHYSHGSEKWTKDSLSIEGYHILCCALRHEMETYMYLLNKAVNLKQEQKQESMEDLFEKCGIALPWEEWKDSCESEL
jgi:hypothetical protein